MASKKKVLNLQHRKRFQNIFFLNIENVFKLHVSTFAHHWHTKALPNIFDTCLQYAKVVHCHNTRYAAKENFHRTRARTNTGKQTISYNTTVIWKKLPPEIKQLKRFSFIKEVKNIYSQHKTLPKGPK